jgi:F0F1-type ATP synthase membrane subunit b/b'
MKLEKEMRLELGSGVRAEIDLRDALLEISGNDEKESSLAITLALGRPPELEEQIEDYVTVEFIEADNVLKIAQTEKKLSGIMSKLHLQLTLPTQSEISCRNKNGSIKAENIKSDQDYVLTNGGIKLVSCNSRLEVRSTNGGISILDHAGDLELAQINGGVVIQDSRGKINVSSNNGGIKLNHCLGDLVVTQKNGAVKSMNSGFSSASVKTINSTIYYEFSVIDSGKFDFVNEHGKIQLIIPGDLEYNIRAKTRQGKIVLGLDKSYEQKGEGAKEFTLVNGSGKVGINVENSLGAIMLLDSLHQQEDIEGKISRKVEILLKEKLLPGLENLTKENAPKIQKQLNKVGEKLSKIELDLPDLESKIKRAINQVTETISVNLEESGEDIEHYKDVAMEKVNRTLENIGGFVSKKKADVEEEVSKAGKKYYKDHSSAVMERSRLKILELLESGKITPDEAEKLLKALGSNKE